MPALLDAFDSLASRRVVLVGGKGGVGKTTIAAAAALHFAAKRKTILFTTDPASNLADLFGSDRPSGLTIESLDSGELYAKFLGENLASFLEIGDRGTYLDRDELRRFFELALPGVDELMAWMRIGEIAEAETEAIVVVDTAPTGHTLRMLGSSEHFAQLGRALDAMQAKHRAMVQQFTRRISRDAIDAFIADFDARSSRRREMLTSAETAAFVPVVLAEPWVVDQTIRLVGEVRHESIDVPFAVLNRAIGEPDCDGDRVRAQLDESARTQLAPLRVVDAPRSCTPLDSPSRIRDWSGGRAAESHPPEGAAALQTDRVISLGAAPILFLAGKGGVGKTTCAASIALQKASANPSRRFVVISVDPAHSLRDVFASEPPPPNLGVETIDTREKWRAFRGRLGQEIEDAVSALAPRGLSLEYDSEAMQRLIEIAPPGADELFAINRLAELFTDPELAGVIVDTAPTGHLLRLLDFPRTAGEWVREFMRLLLRYRELVPSGTLGEELVRASRALKELDETLRSDRARVVVVTRAERVVVAETRRLLEEVETRGMRVGGLIANYVTPESDCRCDRTMRSFESTALAELGRPVVVVERRDAPVTCLEDLVRVVPLS